MDIRSKKHTKETYSSVLHSHNVLMK